MKRFIFGTPEKHVPSLYCREFSYTESSCRFTESDFSFRVTPRGCVLEFPLEAGTEIFGFGLQLKQLRHTGHKITTRVNADPLTPSGEGHAPVPFFVTNKGYGIYVDTARYAEFYCGIRRSGVGALADNAEMPAVSTDALYAARTGGETVMSISIPVASGVAIYVIEGETITDIVSAYNRLSGGGADVPDWGLGVLYRCCSRYDAERVLSVARYFREKQIPCSMLGLEPGWQTHAYSCSYIWDSTRFPDPAGMLRTLREMDFHVNLWEHAFTHPSAKIYDDILPLSGDYAVWEGAVPDFALPAARRIFADCQREHVALGVDGFKLDECDGSDNTGGWSFPLHAAFPSGMDGEQYHSLFGTLYAQTVMEALDGTKTMSEVRNLGALAAPYPFALYSDLYGHRDFVCGTVTAGFSGLLWSPEVRHAQSRKDLLRRVQTTVFSAFCQINAWYCEEFPWNDLDCEAEIRELFTLRASLLPRLRRAYDAYRDTGKPPVRALVMDFTDDAATYGVDDEYMFCDDLLVAPIIGTESDTREVYLPAGEWVDFFTEEPVAAGKHTVTTEGIPVYRRVK